MQQNFFFSLEQVIDRQPLTVSIGTPLNRVISLMQEWGNSCNVVDREADSTVNSNNSCVLIVDDDHLQGIFTERDLVKLVARGTDTQSITVGEIMTKDVVTIVPTGDKDVFAALSLLRKHGIRHLPVVNNRRNPLGLITAKNLRQKLQPLDLMKWRNVSEIMETEVIYAAPDDSVQSIAVLMADRNISCVAICETQFDTKVGRSKVYPVGIITERDVVQFQNLNLDLSLPARNLMSAPLFLVGLQDSLWNIYQQMQEYRVRRLLVADERGELSGIITQSNMLQLFEPTEMYGTIEVLQQQVCQLETEREALLQERNSELEREVKESSLTIATKNQELQIRLRQQQVVAELGQFALTAEDLLSISKRVVDLVARTLEVEYCKVLELTSDGKELLLKAGVGWRDGLVGTAKVRVDSNSQAGYTLLHSEPVIVDDLNSETRFSGPSLLIEHQVVSGVSVIIPDAGKPYGILGIYTTRHRVFTQDDINFIQAIANIIAQAHERRQAEAFLKESQERYTLAVEGSSNGLWDWNVITNEVFYAPRFREMIGYADSEMPNVFEAWASKLHPEDSDRVLTAVQDHLDKRIPFNIEYRLLKKNSDYCWIQARGQAIWNESGQPLRMAGSITDISDRKYREQILKDIASGVSIKTGTKFLPSLVEYLSKALKVDFAYVGNLIQPEKEKIATTAVYAQDKIVDNFEYYLADTPCKNVLRQELCIYPQAVQQLFPNSRLLPEMKAQSFAGMSILNQEGKAIGLVAVVDSKPFADNALIEEVLKIFASRITAELERQQAELALRQSEQKFRGIFDQSFQFIGLLEPNGKIIEANQTALDFVGLKPVNVRGKPFWDTPWWSGSLQAQKLLQQGIEKAATGEFVRFEVEHLGTENRVVTVDFSLTPIKDETGKVVMLIPEGRNISDRKQAEADLATSNQILQAISSIQTQYLTDANPRILFDGMLAHLLELTESEYGFIGEIHFAADGSPTMSESYMKFRGRPYLKTHAITNIAWNEETRAFYAENAPKGMEFHNLETLFGAVIATGEPVIANSPSTDPRRGGTPEGHPPLNAFLGVPFYKNGMMTGMVGIANKRDGYDESLVNSLRPFLDTCSRVVEAYKSDRQRQQAEAKNREQAALLDIATDAIMVRSLDNQLLFWNQGAEKLYGWSKTEALEGDADRLFYRRSTAQFKKIQQVVREQGEWQGELHQVTKDGKEIIVESRWTLVNDEAGNPKSYLVVKTDITEQKQLEAQFLRTQRLESLGTLAGGIAHDLNNILAPILGFSKLLPLKLPDVDEQTKGFFKIMENNANRGAALVKQILTFSRGLEGERGIVQIRHLIAEIAHIVNETFPKLIELATSAPKNLWTVNADVNQLHQVLMNLAVNARDAMTDGGKLTIDAENTTVDAEYARLHLDATEGSYVLITVTDTGSGIPLEVIDRIFEPFFTTKEVGRGTGLGLSTVIGIVKSHGGFVEVTSNSKRTIRGTQFKVYLPASDIAVDSTEEIEEALHGNEELILVVDDETAILEVTKATLETYNYKVLTASDGIKAIATYAQNQEDIKAVIMDIMMPLMDGKTAIRTLKQINPELKIIAVSGLIERQEIVAELDGDVTAFMNKPYSNDDLLKMLREVVSN